MATIIPFPVSKATPSGDNGKGKGNAQVLFFTGVRYERIVAPASTSLPSQRLMPPATRA